MITKQKHLNCLKELIKICPGVKYDFLPSSLLYKIFRESSHSTREIQLERKILFWFKTTVSWIDHNFICPIFTVLYSSNRKLGPRFLRWEANNKLNLYS